MTNATFESSAIDVLENSYSYFTEFTRSFLEDYVNSVGAFAINSCSKENHFLTNQNMNKNLLRQNSFLKIC
jgi:hypothetical protein